MSVPAARVRTSSGWRDIAIQGPQGIAGRTPSCKASSTTTALAWAAADTNGRVYGPAITSVFDDFGGSFASNRWNCTRTGRYVVAMSVENYSASGTSLIGIIKNGATVIKRVQGTMTRGADGSAPGQIVVVEDNFTAGDYVQLWGWHSGGGTAQLTFEAFQLDAPAVSVPSNSPAYVTTTQFAALSPIDGMEVYLIVDATLGQIWHLRYNASSSSAYKWEFLGGGPMLHEIDVDDATTSTSYADLANVGPQLTLPRGGDYMMHYGCSAYNTGASGDVVMSPKKGAAATQDADCIQWNNVGAFKLTSLSRLRRYINASAGDVIKLQYKTTAGQGQFRWRFLAITPVRIS